MNGSFISPSTFGLETQPDYDIEYLYKLYIARKTQLHVHPFSRYFCISPRFRCWARSQRSAQTALRSLPTVDRVRDARWRPMQPATCPVPAVASGYVDSLVVNGS